MEEEKMSEQIVQDGIVANSPIQNVEVDSSDAAQQPLSSESYSSTETKDLERKIQVGEILSLSWNTFKKNAKILLLVVVVYFLIRFFEAFILGILTKGSSLYFAAVIFEVAFNTLIGIGFIQIYLKISRGLGIEVKEIIGDMKYFWRILGGGFLYGLIIISGYILLIVPGVIWTFKYGSFAYLIIDKDMGIMQSLKESGKITYGFKCKLFLLQLTVIPVMILGLLCLGVGIMVSMIIAALMSAYAYRILIGEKVQA